MERSRFQQHGHAASTFNSSTTSTVQLGNQDVYHTTVRKQPSERTHIHSLSNIETSFINPPRYKPDSFYDGDVIQSRKQDQSRCQREGLEDLLQGLLFANQTPREAYQPDVYSTELPPTSSPIDWEARARETSCKGLFAYFCTDLCPPSSSTKNSVADDADFQTFQEKKKPPDKPPDEGQSFLDPPRYHPESSDHGHGAQEKNLSKWKSLVEYLSSAQCFSIIHDGSLNDEQEIIIDEDFENKLHHLTIRRDVMRNDLAQINFQIKEREHTVSLQGDGWVKVGPCTINVLPESVLSSFSKLCCRRQRGGGDTSDTKSTTSTSSNDSASADRILVQLKQTRKKLKKETKNVEKDIAFMKKVKKGTKKLKKSSELNKASEQPSSKRVLEDIDLPPEKKQREVKDSFDDISVPDNFFDETFTEEETQKTAKIDIPQDDPQEASSMTNRFVDQPTSEIVAGQTFPNFQRFEKARQEYSNCTFTIMAKVKSEKNHSSNVSQTDFPYKRVVYACIHHGKIKSKPKDGSRPNQSYNAMGCEFQLSVGFDAKVNNYKVTKFKPNHTGHIPTEQAFKQHRNQNRLSKEQEELFIGHYKENLGLKTRKVREEIMKNTGKVLNAKHILKMVQTRRGKEGGAKEMELLVKQLNEIQNNDNGAMITIVYTDSGEQQFVEEGKHIMKIVHIQTSNMTKRLQNHPNLILFDATYNLCHFIVMPIHVVDHHWKTRLCSVLLMSNETKPVVKESLAIFEQKNEDVLKKLQYHIVDKDFVEIECATSLLKHSQLILCQYHCRKAVDNKINQITLPTKDQHLKKDLKSLFNTMLVSLSKEEYLKAWSDMNDLSHRNKSLSNFYKYMNTNWHQHAESWAACHLKNCKLYENFTNNRSENFNQQLKEIIEKQSSSHLVVREIIGIDKFQELDSIEHDLKSTEKVFKPATSNVNVQEVMLSGKGWLSIETLKRLKEQCEESEKMPDELVKRDEGQVVRTSITGPCLFSSNNGLPCKHLFKTRRLNREQLLTKDMVSRQWHVNPTAEKMENKGSTESIKKPTYLKRNLLARHSKFKSSNNVIKELSASLAQFPEKERQEKMIVLQQHLDMAVSAINNDMEFVFEEDCIKFKSKNISDKKQESEHKEEFRFIYSPKKKNRSYCTGGDAFEYKRKHGSRGARREIQLPLNEWQTSVVTFQKACRSGSPFGHLEFEVLSNLSLTGYQAYMTDSHFENFMILLRLSFPDIGSLQLTSEYEFRGFSKIDPRKDFLQPIHSGGSHWSLLSNIGLTDAERATGCKILYFDSLIHLNDKNTQALIPSAVTWQAAQLLKKENTWDVRPIEIVTVPVEQQSNGHDCGIHVMFNMMALATGLNPSEIVCKSNRRTQLLNMFKENKVKMFDYEKRDDCGPTRAKFTVPSGGKLKKALVLQKMSTSFETICYCQHPRSWDNIVICDSCHAEIHQRCALIGPPLRGAGIADALPNFVCFDCRRSGQYSLGFSVKNAPDHDAIATTASKIEALQKANLASLYGIIINHRKPLPSRLKDYRLIECVYKKFDLNAVCEGKGPIYVAIKNFWTNHLKDLIEPKNFMDLNHGQKIYLALLLICKAEDMELPPIHVVYQEIDLGKSLSQVIDENKKWMQELEEHCQLLNEQMQKLEGLPKNSSKARDSESYLIRQLKELEDFTDAVQQALQHADEHKATEEEKSWKKTALDKCKSFKEIAAIISDQLDEYLRETINSN